MDAKTRSRIRYLFRKSNGLCVNCGKQQPETAGATCKTCRESFVSRNRAKRSNPDICSRCFKPKDDSSKSCCDSCLQGKKLANAFQRSSECGRWIGIIRNASRTLALGHCHNGKNLSSSRHLIWDHEDFAKAFPGFPESGKDIDHIIPLVCADAGDGKLDKDFLDLASGLENLQLLTRSENVTKAANLDRQIIARAKDLRQQGKSGADLFHQLWAEFAWPQRQEG